MSRVSEEKIEEVSQLAQQLQLKIESGISSTNEVSMATISVARTAKREADFPQRFIPTKGFAVYSPFEVVNLVWPN